MCCLLTQLKTQTSFALLNLDDVNKEKEKVTHAPCQGQIEASHLASTSMIIRHLQHGLG
jgi:hypothetical protein